MEKDLQIHQHTKLGYDVKNILFPTDFSANALSAFEAALFIAERFQANIHLYHAYHYASTGEFYLVPELIEEINTTLREQALNEFQVYEQKARESLGNKAGLAFHTDSDFAVDGITRMAQEVNADLIMMGTEGAEGFIDKWLGSVSSQVAEKVDVPLMVLPKSFQKRSFINMVYATNFEEAESEIPPITLQFQKALQVPLTCVHIRPLKDQREGSYQDQLTQIKNLTAKEGIPFQILHGMSPWQGIQSFVKEKNVDLLVMYTHHHSLREKIWEGSLSRKAVQELDIPMLILHA
ncbi:MAG: universal stress protein [Bacteroidota bacterium]